MRRCAGNTITPTRRNRLPATRRRSSRSCRLRSTSGRRRARSRTNTTVRPARRPIRSNGGQAGRDQRRRLGHDRSVARRLDVLLVCAGRHGTRAHRCRRHAQRRQREFNQRPRSPDDARMGSCARSHSLEPRDRRHGGPADDALQPAGHAAGRRYSRLSLPVRIADGRCRRLMSCSLPPTIDFGNATIGMTSVPQNVTFTNSGNAPLSIQTADVADTAQFKHVVGLCAGNGRAAGRELHRCGHGQPGHRRRRQIAARAVHQRRLLRVAAGRERRDHGTGSRRGTDRRRDRVLQRVARSLLHHVDRRRDRESGRRQDADRWTRTGKSFKAYTAAQAGTSQVCRFYIPPRSATRTSSAAAPPSATPRIAAQPGIRARRAELHARRAADRRHLPEPARNPCIALFNNRVGRQSPLHDRPRGARPDGRARAGSPKATARISW